MSELTSKLVAYCGSVQYEDLPPAAVAAAKVEILDSLGVGLGGFGLEGIQELLEVVCEWGGAAQSSVIGHAGMLPAPSAAFVNAAMMHALDYDGGHTGAFVHTGVVTIPAVFAAAERAGGMTGREMLVTAAMGTDIFCRLGLGLRSDVSKARSGWHWTTVLGYLSSAMIAGRIFGLNEEQLRHALGIAFHQCAGNTQGVASGALTKRIGPGFAVRGGLTAALMAERGITGAEDIFQGGYDLCMLYGRTDRYDADAFLDGLGSQFHGTRVDVKIYPCGGMMFPFIDAALELVADHKIDNADIESISVRHGDGSRGFVEPLSARREPRNAVDTQFSIPWVVAVALAKGRVTPASFTNAAIRDPEILAITNKITAQFDPELNQVGGLESGRVDLHLKGGTTLSCHKDNYMSGTDGVMAYDKVVDKFMDCADFSDLSIPQHRLQETVDLIRNLEELDDATTVMRHLCRQA